jgi:hypothetical protein
MDADVREGFVAEVTRFRPQPFTEAHPIATLAELDALLAGLSAEAVWVIGLACDEGAGGALYLFASGSRALLHLTAGRSFVTEDPCNADPPESRAVFRLDTGELREVHPRRTVSLREGIGALRYWFVNEDQEPGLGWVVSH